MPLLRPEVRLAEGERLEDAEAGCVAIALKRASLFGRAPVIHDLRIAYALWGYLSADAPADLVAERRRRFEGVHLTAHHYPELRAVVDAVPADTLRLTPAQIASQAPAGWRELLSL
ncbi:MAG: hypothetical protein R2746_10215 [Acidimicrobiales bacterium]